MRDDKSTFYISETEYGTGIAAFYNGAFTGAYFIDDDGNVLDDTDNLREVAEVYSDDTAQGLIKYLEWSPNWSIDLSDAAAELHLSAMHAIKHDENIDVYPAVHWLDDEQPFAPAGFSTRKRKPLKLVVSTSSHQEEGYNDR